MPVRVAINGFGRIGRCTFRIAFGNMKNLKIVAINDLTDTKTLAHLLKHDTSYGAYGREVSYDETGIIVDGVRIPVSAEKEPQKLPWKKLKVDVVLECTGRFTKEEKAKWHIDAGAKLVILSAPGKGGNIPTKVLGVNSDKFGKEVIINNASCTTNCIAPVCAVLEKEFGIKRAFMTTVHGYTADQNLVDGPHSDLRRARAAAANIVPTSTGAAIAVGDVVPTLKGVFEGFAIRVPTPVCSLADMTFLMKMKVTVEQVNAALTKAANGKMKGVLAVTNEKLVSSDFVKNANSSIVDLPLTKVIEGDFLKVVAWYDNEWGYSARLAEMAELFATKMLGGKKK